MEKKIPPTLCQNTTHPATAKWTGFAEDFKGFPKLLQPSAKVTIIL